MIRDVRKVFRIGMYVCIFFLISTILVFALSITPQWGDALLCIEVHPQNGEHINISCPLSMINTLMDILPRELRELCNELDISAQDIANELKTARGIDLVNIKGRDNVRIYVTDGTIQEGIIKVHVQNLGGDISNVYVAVPRGFLVFGGKIVKWFGISDTYIDLPPALKHLEIVHPS